MDRIARKKQLIAQGGLHRTGLLLARQDIRDGARPAALGQSVMRQVLSGTAGAIGTGRQGFDPKTMLSLLTACVPLLKKRKPWIGVAVAAAAVLAGMTAIKRTRHAEDRLNDL